MAMAMAMVMTMTMTMRMTMANKTSKNKLEDRNFQYRNEQNQLSETKKNCCFICGSRRLIRHSPFNNNDIVYGWPELGRKTVGEADRMDQVGARII